MLGAGQLVSALWKSRHPGSAMGYQFNIYRMSDRTGQVSQLLHSGDLPDLLKLCQVLATALAEEPCLSAEHRRSLADLAVKLDAITQTKF